ncbi:MAG: hypothetical protein IKX31_09835 [Muribaculaceae bacterium]|nr:hypothetical protein [Muribaculaceae bacterium]
MRKIFYFLSICFIASVSLGSCDVNRDDYVGQWQGVARDTTNISLSLNQDGTFSEEITTIDKDSTTVTCQMQGQWSINGKDIEADIDLATVKVSTSGDKADVAQELEKTIKEQLEKHKKEGAKIKVLASASVMAKDPSQTEAADTLCGTYPTQGSVKLARISEASAK